MLLYNIRKGGYMKKYILLLAVLTAGVFVFAKGTSDDVNTKKIIVGTEGIYEPFSYHDDNQVLVGYDVEVAQAVAKTLGYEIDFIESKWDGLLAGLPIKRWDVVANQVWENDERNNDFSLSDSYMDAGAAVLVQSDSDIYTIEDLRGKKAAVSLTSAYKPLVEDITSEFVINDDFVATTNLLSAGRIDFLVNDAQAIGRYLYKNPKSGLRAIKWDEAGVHKVVFALAKDNQTLTAEINTALATLHGDGTIDAIYEKYFTAIK